MKVRLVATASSNHTYRREAFADLEDYGYSIEQWNALSREEQYKELDEWATEWLYEDIDVFAEVVEK